MLASDTIVAVASGVARAPRGIIRLSGPATLGVLSRLLVDPAIRPGAHRARLRLSENRPEFDLPCLVLFFEGPRSYTGDDAAELQVPGSPHLLQRVMSRILGATDDTGSTAVRLAQPGEFTARAYLAGKLDAARAEGVGALIGARTEAELGAAQALLSGETGSIARALADEIAIALALVEAGIDFTDQEDVVAIEPDDLAERLEAAISTIDDLIGPGQAREARTSAPRVVLVGPPNAGKSTLFNALLGRERTVASDAPGTTRDVICESLVLRDEMHGWEEDAVDLVDLAGIEQLGGAGDPLAREAQLGAHRAIEEADVLIACDPEAVFNLPVALEDGRPVIRVRTKGDLPQGSEIDREDLSVCALDGWNLGSLRRAIADAAGRDSLASEKSRAIPRHHQALRAARGSLVEALEACAPSRGGRMLEGTELIAGSMRVALDEVGQVVGEVTPDDVIGRIFATFCVGK